MIYLPVVNHFPERVNVYQKKYVKHVLYHLEKSSFGSKWLYFVKTLKLLPKIQTFAQICLRFSFHKTQDILFQDSFAYILELKQKCHSSCFSNSNFIICLQMVNQSAYFIMQDSCKLAFPTSGLERNSQPFLVIDKKYV